MTTRSLLGGIADDFTGATDLAQTFVSNGMPTVLLLDVPTEAQAAQAALQAAALVVCLKIRTSPKAEAVNQAVASLRVLRSVGCGQFVWKYCSTFDSTPEGNIGPVADALRQELGAKAELVCPAFPENGRTVYQGHLFVRDTLLHETSMRDHPLTPMCDSNLLRLLAPQTPFPCGLIPLPVVREGQAAVRAAFAELVASGVVHIIADAVTDADLRVLAEACADHPLLTGGSGIARGLPAFYRQSGSLTVSTPEQTPAGPALVLAGSCSSATRGQIRHFLQSHPSVRLDPMQLAESGTTIVDEAERFALRCMSEGVIPLIYGSAEPAEVQAAQQALGRERAGALMEAALSELAIRLTRQGVRRLVVAGGETSGAVAQKLGVTALRVGATIAPGVPWTATLDADPLYLALKSGNFGDEAFFSKAIAQ